MFRPRKPGDGFREVELELIQAKFDTLSRLTAEVENRIARLEELAERIRAGETDQFLKDKYNRLRKEAGEYAWYVRVQRDVMNFRGRAPEFRIPPALKDATAEDRP